MRPLREMTPTLAFSAGVLALWLFLRPAQAEPHGEMPSGWQLEQAEPAEPPARIDQDA